MFVQLPPRVFAAVFLMAALLTWPGPARADRPRIEGGRIYWHHFGDARVASCPVAEALKYGHFGPTSPPKSLRPGGGETFIYFNMCGFGGAMTFETEREAVAFWTEVNSSHGRAMDSDTPDPSVDVVNFSDTLSYVRVTNSSKTKSVRVSFVSVYNCVNVALGCGDNSPNIWIRPGLSAYVRDVSYWKTNSKNRFEYKIGWDWK